MYIGLPIKWSLHTQAVVQFFIFPTCFYWSIVYKVAEFYPQASNSTQVTLIITSLDLHNIKHTTIHTTLTQPQSTFHTNTHTIFSIVVWFSDFKLCSFFNVNKQRRPDGWWAWWSMSTMVDEHEELWLIWGILRGWGVLITDKQANKWTFMILESLSRPKTENSRQSCCTY